MKLKKIVGFITTLGAIALMSVGVQAAAYSVESASANAGENVTVKVQAAPNTGETSTSINGYAIQISYDSSVLTPVATGNTDATGASTYAENLLSSGVMVADVVDSKIAIGWANASATTVNSTTDLAKVTFKVADGATVKSTDLTVVVVASAKNSTTLETTNEAAGGTITLGSDILYGDVDGDGSVTADDASLVKQHIAKVITLEGDFLEAADVDGNSNITADDVSLIRQFVAKAISKFPVEE